MAAYTSTRAGNSSATATWGGSGPPTTGDTIVIAVVGSAVSGAASNGSGLVRLTVGSTTNWTTGQYAYVAGVTGTTEANGLWVVTVVDGTHLDLQGSTFANAWVSGGNANCVVNIDTSVALGSNTGTVGHAFTINGTSATQFGCLIVANGVNLAIAGKDGGSNTMGMVNRYGIFQPMPGSTITGTPAADWGSGIINNGVMIAQGTGGSPITFTNDAASYTWGTQVTGEATITGGDYQYDQASTPKIGAFALGHRWIANSAGTGPGSLGNSSLSFPTHTQSNFTNEVASISAIAADGDFYVNYDVGAVWYYATGKTAPTITSTYKYLVLSKTWYIQANANTTYNSLLLDYCTLQYMGSTTINGYNAALQIANKYAASVQANRLFQVTNCTISNCGNVIDLANCNGNANGLDYIRIDNNTINTNINPTSYGGPFLLCNLSASTYVSFSNNVLNCYLPVLTFQFNGDFTGWKIDGNTGFSETFFYNTGPAERSDVTSKTTFGGTVISNNSLTGIGKNPDINQILAPAGTAGSVCTIRNNFFGHVKRWLNIGPNLVVTQNKLYGFYHHGIITTASYEDTFITNVTITDNIFISGGPIDGLTWIQMGYNHRVHCDNWLIANNTLCGCGIDLGDSADGGMSMITRTQIINNLIVNDFSNNAYGIRRGADSSTVRYRIGLTQLNNNLIYNLNTAYSNITHQAWFNRSGVAYNLDATRNVLGVSLWDASYSTPPAAMSLVLTVNTPDSDVTLGWGGGTAAQLILGTNGTGTIASSTINTCTVTGATWSTARNNAGCPQGCWIKITGGTGSGQIRGITFNTATILTVSQAWTTPPDGTSTYAIYQSEVQLYDSGATYYIRAGIYLLSLPTTTQTDTSITMTFAEVLSDPQLPIGSSCADLTVADYIPGGSSPAIAAGIATNAPTSDYLGVSWSGASPDIGALAFVGATENIAATKGDATIGGEGCAINVYLGRSN